MKPASPHRDRDGWGEQERRKLLTAIREGVWTVSGAAYRFGLPEDRIVGWLRTEPMAEIGYHACSGGGLATYVELL